RAPAEGPQDVTVSHLCSTARPIPDALSGCHRLAANRSIQTFSQEFRFVTLAMIVAATVLSGALSVLVAAALSLTSLAKVVRQIVSLSAGFLLATAVLRLLPEAFESDLDPHSLAWALLAGLIAFCLLEKMAVL